MDKLNKWGILRATFSAAIACFVFAASAFGAAVVQDVKGDARAAVGTATPAAITKSQNVLTGTTLTTGPGSQLILKFDDGQQLVLNENTRFRITDYQFLKDDPKADRSVFDLLSGAARIVTGLLGQRSRTAFRVGTATATIGIRGTDFMVAQIALPGQPVPPTYVGVSPKSGPIGVSTDAGTTDFSESTYGEVTARTALPRPIPFSALPAAVAGAFSSLSAAAVSAAVGAATGTGLSTGAIAVGAGVVAAGAAAAASNRSSSTPAATSSTTSSAFAGSWSGTWSESITPGGLLCGSPVSTSVACNGTWSGSVDSTGLSTSTYTITSCGGQPVTGSSFTITSQVSSTGAVASSSPPTVGAGSGLTTSCTNLSGNASSTSGLSFSGSFSCTVSGTTSCPPSGTPGTVNYTETISITGHSP